MIEKRLESVPGEVRPVEVEVDPVELDIEGEGALIIELVPVEEEDAFGANLADYVDESDLLSLASELGSFFDEDLSSRADWERTYVDGLEHLGMKVEDRTEPWPGAFGAHHPMLAEAVVRFQAQAIMELFPASGPARTAVLGESTSDKEQQASRVRREMNYQLTEKMPEFRSEMEQMLFRLPLAGSAFKKVYYDPDLGRPCSMFVPAEDMVIPYGASDIRSTPRLAQVIRKDGNWIRKRQVAGFYRDLDIGDPGSDSSQIQDKHDELSGIRQTGVRREHTLIEYHIELDLPGFEDPDGVALPYVVTFDKDTLAVYAIRRNWYEDDPNRERRIHYIHYPYMPGLGVYGTGLIHLVGGLAKSATSILRQLVDAGTLANLPGGLKARGFRIKEDAKPIKPAEFRDVDIPGGSIRDAITFLPYKEPSSVLYQLLGTVVDEGRRIGSVADMKVAENQNPSAPVGTTLAVIERTQKVMSAVQARLHAAQRQEMKLIAQLIHDHMPPEYDYENGGHSRREDFDGRVDIIPVSDPNASSTALRTLQFQEALRLSEMAPDIYDKATLHREMLRVLNIPNVEKIVPDEGDHYPVDPVSENMAILNGDPTKAFLHQDHEAHIKVHMAAAQDPKLLKVVGQSPRASEIQAAMVAHVTEHVAFQYRKEVEKQLGTPLPPPDEPLPEDVEVQLSSLISQAAEQLFQKNRFEAEQEENKQKIEDPVVQAQKRDLDIREREVARKEAADKRDHELALAKLQSEEKMAGAKLGAELVSTQEEVTSREAIAGAKIGAQAGQVFANRDNANGTDRPSDNQTE